MGLESQIERTGRKRRRKRILIALIGVGALTLGGGVTVLLAPSTGPSSRTVAATEPTGPVTEEDGQQALAEAEAMQALVSDLGAAFLDAGIGDMKTLEDLMAQTVVVATAADQMVEAWVEEDDEAAQGARGVYQSGVRDGRRLLETALRQLADAGVDTKPLADAAANVGLARE